MAGRPEQIQIENRDAPNNLPRALFSRRQALPGCVLLLLALDGVFPAMVEPRS